MYYSIIIYRKRVRMSARLIGYRAYQNNNLSNLSRTRFQIHQVQSSTMHSSHILSRLFIRSTQRVDTTRDRSGSIVAISRRGVADTVTVVDSHMREK